MTSPAKHTPGPWLLDRKTIYTLAPDGTRNHWWASVQTQSNGASHEECMANALLIAAAPELFEALEKALPKYRGVVEMLDEVDAAQDLPIIELCEAALAKARGEQS